MNIGKALANRSFCVGLIVTSLIALVALVSFVWTPYPVGALDIAGKLKPPSAAHWLGTDHFGRDILSMIMVGSRNSIAVASVSVAIGAGIGVPLGLWGAATGGCVDEVLMRFNDLGIINSSVDVRDRETTRRNLPRRSPRRHRRIRRLRRRIPTWRSPIRASLRLRRCIRTLRGHRS